MKPSSVLLMLGGFSATLSALPTSQPALAASDEVMQSDQHIAKRDPRVLEVRVCRPMRIFPFINTFKTLIHGGALLGTVGKELLKNLLPKKTRLRMDAKAEKKFMVRYTASLFVM
jgi:hypothetical protein